MNSAVAQGATITLAVTVNNESFTINGNIAITDTSGIATFPNLRNDKPGGYMSAVSQRGGSVSAKS